ncbi:hypothetical protein [Flavobacterium poyangense]|uniref:hypothetical protein n=1 Tax=Flavobacterium poyangense TaxID=2204302 RepID=UPI001422E789|nr:hypothetical protein [Flavobacterium sp. JXAS1]
MMRKIITAITFAFLACSITQAQTVQKIGDNPTEINKTAVLEVASSTKGFLPPRMTTVQRDAITTPANGLIVYNTDTKKLEVFDGTSWSSGGGGNDNLGDHTATKDLDMKNNSISDVKQIDLNYQMLLKYPNSKTNSPYFSLYNQGGLFKIWSSNTSSDALMINATTGKTVLTSASIANGTDGVAPETGQVAKAAENGNIVWKSKALLSEISSNQYINNTYSQDIFIVSNYTGPGANFITFSCTNKTFSGSVYNVNITSGTVYTIKNNNSSAVCKVNLNDSGADFYVNGVLYQYGFEIPRGQTVRFVCQKNDTWHTF